jgi:hypothetical protein
MELTNESKNKSRLFNKQSHNLIMLFLYINTVLIYYIIFTGS